MPTMLSQIRVALCAAFLALSAAPLRATEGIATESPRVSEFTASYERASHGLVLDVPGNATLALSRQSYVAARQGILQQQTLSEHPTSKLASAIAAAGTV